jgi:hypothetical protein
MRRMKWLCLIAIFLLVAVAACTKYERKVVPFQLPAAYPNATEAAEATIAAKAYDGKDEAGNAFGFDIRGAGILPVQVIFDNKGAHSLEILPAQTFLVDEANNLWPILDANLAYDRMTKKTELGNVVPEGAKSGMLAGAAGGIIGAAIGIVTGTNVGEAAAKGAAIGENQIPGKAGGKAPRDCPRVHFFPRRSQEVQRAAPAAQSN